MCTFVFNWSNRTRSGTAGNGITKISGVQSRCRLYNTARLTSGSGITRKSGVCVTDAVLAESRVRTACIGGTTGGQRRQLVWSGLYYQVRTVVLAKAALEQQGQTPQDIGGNFEGASVCSSKAVAQSRRFSWDELYNLIGQLALRI